MKYKSDVLPTEAAQPPAQDPQGQGQGSEPQAENNEGQGEDAAVTPLKLAGSKARVEYRDQHGNVLPDDLVSSLRDEGKVKFETRYESKSRLQNAQEIPIVDGQLAPPHPDVEGQNPETGGSPEDSVPPESPASVEQGNERSAEQPKSPEAKPASDGNQATH